MKRALSVEAHHRPRQRRRGAVYGRSSFRHRVHAAEMPPIPEIALMIGCPSLPFGYFPDNFRGM
jgi:hypothetical protein